MRKRQISLLLILLFLFACTTVQTDYNKLTLDEKVRFKIGVAQSQLETLFDSGKSYVNIHPEYQVTWKTKVIPAFDTANKTLRTIILMEQQGTITPETIDSQMNPLIDSITNLLLGIGWIK